MENNKEIRVFKNELYRQYSRIGKCLSSDKRLELLDLLSQRPSSVENLAVNSGMNVANVSRHLQILLEAKLVDFNKDGNRVIYSVRSEAISYFLSSLWQLSENQLPDIAMIKEDFLSNISDTKTLTLEEVKTRMETGNILLIDVRSSKEYMENHIPGAVSVPADEIDEYIKTISPKTEIAAYCRGPFCIHSSEVVEKLSNVGFDAYRIKEW